MSIIRRIWDRMIWRLSFITPAVTTTQPSHQIPFWLTLLSRDPHLFLANCCRYFLAARPTTEFDLKTLCFDAQSCALFNYKE